MSPLDPKLILISGFRGHLNTMQSLEKFGLGTNISGLSHIVAEEGHQDILEYLIDEKEIPVIT